MAEILKLGAVISNADDERAKKWHRDVTCRRCKTLFRCGVGDVELHDDSYGGSQLFDPYTTCPNCGMHAMLWFVPFWVRRLVNEEYGKECKHCGRSQRQHQDGGKCLFEPTSFSGVKVK